MHRGSFRGQRMNKVVVPVSYAMLVIDSVREPRLIRYIYLQALCGRPVLPPRMQQLIRFAE